MTQFDAARDDALREIAAEYNDSYTVPTFAEESRYDALADDSERYGLVVVAAGFTDGRLQSISLEVKDGRGTGFVIKGDDLKIIETAGRD